MIDASVWAKSATAGEYLVRYSEGDSTPETDPGSRCGYDDRELDDARRVLRSRGLRLETDDRGILAVEA